MFFTLAAVAVLNGLDQMGLVEMAEAVRPKMGMVLLEQQIQAAAVEVVTRLVELVVLG